MRLLFLLAVVPLLSAYCPPGARYRQGSFYKECTENRDIIRAGCFADWLWGDAAYVPFGSTVDHLLHSYMGYRFACESNGRSYSFQIRWCLYRNDNGEIADLQIGESANVRGRNGRSMRFTCRP